MLSKTKTVSILAIMIFIIVVVGFVLILTRKQSVNAATGEVKYFWKNPKDDTPAAPAPKTV